ncbi:CoA-disulfide reductase [uncultured spirochete]|jgi:NADPH-dependent 2,4-dienoyl-CoA reductase/sulfur reductase-like enzyme/rhodanese-related sulfurtransferase|uniref:CoA-disulfide reductase n=1 Tax=uncultured spirochete TaxID=156406 RepID=A0A3P3XT71_9SPIR|nr:CoA-disulfide reductase [uncultured spirochete]
MKLVIIGGVAAGATAAARARRIDEKAKITILEKGPYVSFANCGLPYRISGDIQKRGRLILQTAEGFFARYRVDVMLNTEAIGIDRQNKQVRVKSKDGESVVPYDKLILAQGGTPIRPQIDGLDSPNVFNLWTIPDTDKIEAFIKEYDPKSAIVVGGGFIGLEAAEAFNNRGISTTIVELMNQVMPPADPEFGAQIAEALAEHGVQAITGKSVVRIDWNARRATLSDDSTVSADMVLLAVGVRPNLELAKQAGLATGSANGLVVDEYLRTNDPDIYAAGDMVEVVRVPDGTKVRIPLAGPANRQGRLAATNALGGSMKYAGAMGTSVVKVMDYTFSMTGLSEKAAKAANIDVRAVTIHKAHHATYYPGSEDLSLKIIYQKSDGKVLGAQAFGKEGVEKRIDVLAVAVHAGLSLEDIAELDLAYAPPYSSANDPMQMASFAALNDMHGFSKFVTAQEAMQPIRQGTATILDVRTYAEYLNGHIKGSVHIPLDELRDRIEEVPSEQILIVSKAGFEGHLAYRQLIQNAKNDIRYISGGYTSLRLLQEAQNIIEEGE